MSSKLRHWISLNNPHNITRLFYLYLHKSTPHLNLNCPRGIVTDCILVLSSLQGCLQVRFVLGQLVGHDVDVVSNLCGGVIPLSVLKCAHVIEGLTRLDLSTGGKGKGRGEKGEIHMKSSGKQQVYTILPGSACT